MKILTFLLLTFTTTAFAVKIGYINIDNVVSSSPQFIEANQTVISEFKPKEKKLILLREKIEKLLIKFSKNKDDLSKAEIQSAVKEISALEGDLKQKLIKLQQDLKLRNTTELDKIEKLINQTINSVAKEKKFDLILYQKVAFVSDKLDITSLISKKLKALFK